MRSRLRRGTGRATGLVGELLQVNLGGCLGRLETGRGLGKLYGRRGDVALRPIELRIGQDKVRAKLVNGLRKWCFR